MTECEFKADPARHLPREYPLALLTVGELVGELRRLRRALATRAPDTEPDVTSWEWRECIEAFTTRLPTAEPRIGTLQALAREATETERAALAFQIRRALKACRYVERCPEPDWHSTETLLVPVSYAERLSLVLGQGMLPVAWVRRLDLLRF